MATDINLQEVHDVLVEVAEEAGRMITAADPSLGSTGSKKNAIDLVTETDRAVESFIAGRLRARFPSIGFMGEETYRAGDRLAADGATFIVDPIDGTTNFVHGHPAVAVSIGLALGGRRPALGVVHNPFTRELYAGIRGRGSFYRAPWLGDGKTARRLPLRDRGALPGLRECLIAVEWGSDRAGNDMRVKSETFRRLCASPDEGGAMVHSLRSLGSAALNLCAVARGDLDCYWEAGCWAWDVCAGWVILEEAGGLVADANPGNWEPQLDGRRYLAVRGAGGDVDSQKRVVEELWSNVAGRFEVGA